MSKRFRRTARYPKSFLSSENEGMAETADTIRSDIKSFLAFVYRRSRELDEVHTLNWSLSLLFDAQLLKEYFEYCLEVGIHVAPRRLLQHIRAGCRFPSYLSVYHSPEGYELGAWTEYAGWLGAMLKSFIDDMKRVHETLDGKRNVAFIIDSESPEEHIAALSTTLKRQPQYYKKGSRNWWARIRTSYFFELSLVCPLRISNALALRLSEPTTSMIIRQRAKPALYWDVDKGTYVIFVPKAYLKNRRAKQIESIFQPLPDYLNKLTERFIADRALFLARNPQRQSDRLLLKKGISGFGQGFSLHTKEAIRGLWPALSTKGVNPHGMRHLTATLFLRYHPENFTALATLLNDDLRTVIQVYAKKDDRMNAERIRNWSAQVWGPRQAA